MSVDASSTVNMYAVNNPHCCCQQNTTHYSYSNFKGSSQDEQVYVHCYIISILLMCLNRVAAQVTQNLMVKAMMKTIALMKLANEL